MSEGKPGMSEQKREVSHVAIILPCLNEEEVLVGTCRSLGFGMRGEGQIPKTILFIVDNGSADETLAAAREIRDTSLPDTVLLATEPERGYVPPRHTGNMLAKGFAEANGLNPSEVLILQADADTLYGEGYIEEMRRAAAAAGPNMLLEAAAEHPPGFKNSFPDYIRRLAETDERVLSRLKLSDADDLICTDAVCAYRLGDYFVWGGHLREYRDDGEEIHAETTRLRIRSLARQAGKMRVEHAVAHPSERKTLLRPAEEFATAGFPRDAAWRAAWERHYLGPQTVWEFGAAHDRAVAEAIRLRERHLLALFGLLPLHVARALESPLPLADLALREIAASLPARDAGALTHRPGLFITDVLNVVDNAGAVLDELLAGGGASEEGA
jgi:glycosyltransferase involved in cell wall biosynthesis